jgi:hypothetical protein
MNNPAASFTWTDLSSPLTTRLILLDSIGAEGKRMPRSGSVSNESRVDSAVALRPGLSRLRRAGETAAGGMVIVLCTAVAGLGDPGREQIRLNAADMRAARATVVHRWFFGPQPGWKGGLKKPTLPSPAPSCSSYHPKQSDLVVTGVAESAFQGHGFYFDSASQVLKTVAMVSLDWRRSVYPPGAVACAGRLFARKLPHGQKLLWFRRLRAPHLASHVAGFRALISVPGRAGSRFTVITDILLFAQGRTEITFVAAASARMRRQLVGWEDDLVGQLMGRLY